VTCHEVEGKICVLCCVVLGQVFDSAIGAAYQEAAAAATPVVNINMHTEGKYAFVELATEEFAAAAMQLDKLDLCGRALNVARPSGYVDPATQTAQQAAMVSVLGAVFTSPYNHESKPRGYVS